MYYNDNFDEQIRYAFKKPYVAEVGTIPEGTEIILLGDNVFVNGGMCDPYSRKLLLHIVNDPKKNKEYLVRRELVNNTF